jgi:hypothetical protein
MVKPKMVEGEKTRVMTNMKSSLTYSLAKIMPMTT